MKKILFSDKYGLTEAVLEGRKTQTRRVVTESVFQRCRTNAFKEKGFSPAWETRCKELLLLNSNYMVGEVVAVAQKYADFRMPNGDVTDEFYKLCCEHYMPLECLSSEKGCNNKMFVKAELMPHHIRITNIRVEQLQDISDEDCMAEGVYYHTEPPKHHEYDRYSPWSTSVKPYKFESEKYFCSAKHAFMHLIDKVSGKGTWDSNPYVFVYEFELVK